jgi:hypothetical protein
MAPTDDFVLSSREGCAWLEADGTFCDRSLTADDIRRGDIFCAHHPAEAVRARYRPPDVDVPRETQAWAAPSADPVSGRQIGPLESAHLVALTQIDRQSQPDGVLVLTLARAIDDGSASGSGLAALAGRLQSAAKDAYAGAAPGKDSIDELARRRTERLAELAAADESADG